MENICQDDKDDKDHTFKGGGGGGGALSAFGLPRNLRLQRSRYRKTVTYFSGPARDYGATYRME